MREFVMLYPWPTDADAVLLDDALEIAMGYLELKGLTREYGAVQKRAADIILEEWRKGARHRLRLSNAAIVAIESPQVPVIRSVFPRVV